MNNILKSFWKTVLFATLAAGVGDLILAYSMQTIRTGQFPAKMLLYMAGALALERSMAGGLDCVPEIFFPASFHVCAIHEARLQQRCNGAIRSAFFGREGPRSFRSFNIN